MNILGKIRTMYILKEFTFLRKTYMRKLFVTIGYIPLKLLLSLFRFLVCPEIFPFLAVIFFSFLGYPLSYLRAAVGFRSGCTAARSRLPGCRTFSRPYLRYSFEELFWLLSLSNVSLLILQSQVKITFVTLDNELECNKV